MTDWCILSLCLPLIEVEGVIFVEGGGRGLKNVFLEDGLDGKGVVNFWTTG